MLDLGKEKNKKQVTKQNKNQENLFFIPSLQKGKLFSNEEIGSRQISDPKWAFYDLSLRPQNEAGHGGKRL